MHNNTRVYLTRRPNGMPTPADFTSEIQTINDVPDEHVVIKVDTLSVDAFIRTTLDGGEGLHTQSAVGGTIMALGVGEVIETNSASLAVGDWVTGPLMAQTHTLMPAAAMQKIEPSSNIPPSTYLGVLGLTTGITAWVGLIRVGKVTEADTVAVSGAAGAVGTVVTQLAKARGAKVIGIAGGPKKCAFLTDTLGLDGAVDYKAGNTSDALAELAPNGIDLFFDNVGGDVLDAALYNLAMNGRVVLCGGISQYQNMDQIRGPSQYLKIAERNASMLGFTVDHYPEVFEEAGAELSRLLVEGEMNLPEQVVTGIEEFPAALITLLTGGHTGKMLVKP